MKAKDLREKSLEDLKELEKTSAKAVFEARFKNFTNRLDDTSSIRKAKRELARVKTLLAERARGAAPAAKAETPAPAAKKAKAAPAAEAKPAKKAASKKASKKAATPQSEAK